ncbi:MAG: amino acid adenylation domain-containing protein, partial [Anaerolineales bacterium]|nr:amino acid adenylation domain-containing protein [Anaerolineales bacterium]
AVEETIAAIWSAVLGIRPIGILDNFFELGGHSLSATQIISRLQEQFQTTIPFHTFFAEPTIAALAQQIGQASASASATETPMTRLPRATQGDTIAPTSYSQQRLWFLEQLDPGKATFNLPLVLTLNGRLDTNALHQAINQMVARHETLRTTFFTEGGVPQQRIHPPQAVPLERVDLQHLPLANREQAASEQLYAATYRTFNLVTGPLLRATLFCLSETEHWLLIAMHHIVTDGWSVGVMQAELTELYRANATSQPANLPELPVQYADFAAWQHDWLQTETAVQQIAYWKKQLTGMPPYLELPTDHPRPVQATGHGAQHRFDLPTELVAQLNELSQSEAATPYMTLLTAFLALLHRYTEQDDLVVGTTIANRTRADIEPLIGFFLNSLVLRTDLSGNPTFRELLSRVRQTTLDAFANQQIPVEKLIETLNPTRQGTNLPLFQVLFIYQNMPRPTLDWPELAVTRRRLDMDVTKFDLTLTVIEQDAGLQFLFEYNSDLFEAATIKRLFNQLQMLLSSVIEAPTTAVAKLPLLTTTETADLLALAQGPQLAAPPFTAVPQWFEAQVEQSAEETAVVLGEQTISYSQLNRRANQLAHYLQKQGVTRNSIVGLCFDRSIDMIVGLWGILKAGGAYLPLDPAYPAERLAYMLDDAKVQTVVTRTEFAEVLPKSGLNLVQLDQNGALIAAEATSNLLWVPAANDLAYVIYTSGSTGRPKGVMIPHRALVHFTQAAIHLYGFTKSDRTLQFATINFDAAVEEIFPTLVQGATLCLRAAEMMDTMAHFVGYLNTYAITILDLPTAFWHQLVNCMADDNLTLPESLRLVIIGGEKASAQKVATWHSLIDSEVRLFNTYGPTEVTVVATAYEIPTDGVPQLISQGVPIGLPLANNQAFVLDAQQQPVPPGIPGELVLGGPQVALGYLHRPQKTAAAFIPHPFREGESVYRTGDRVRLLPDGNLEFWGRVDDQIKIRGFRIEPAEIEAFLVRETAVNEAIVLPQPDANGEMQLVAYVVPENDTVSRSELRTALQRSMPPYMVPAVFVLMETLPLTANGKINKRALPTDFEINNDRAMVAPRTETEAILAAVWQKLLGINQVSVHDNFFELGGHSLKAMQLVSRIRKSFGVVLSLGLLFEATDLAEMATAIDALQQVILTPETNTLPDSSEDFETGEL